MFSDGTTADAPYHDECFSAAGDMASTFMREDDRRKIEGTGKEPPFNSHVPTAPESIGAAHAEYVKSHVAPQVKLSEGRI